LQHYNILRWLSEDPGRWRQTDDFLARWAITKKHLARILGQLCACMLIERARNPRKKGNASVYRIDQRGLDMIEAGLAALQYTLYKRQKGHV
jgi:DNA-binding HxlR family transcriptional regulator